MISYNFKHQLLNAGIAIDMFGQKLQVGDIVLCKGYGSSDKDQIATIKKINRKSVVVGIQCHRADYGKYSPRPNNHKGHWNFYPDYKITTSTEDMRRLPLDMLRIPDSLYASITTAEEQLMNEYPELAI